MLTEKQIEQRLKRGLESRGFKVLKLVTPGYNGTPDRLIMRPTYAPAPPRVVEAKRPGEAPRLLQVAVAEDWRARGWIVRSPISTYEEVDALIALELGELGESSR